MVWGKLSIWVQLQLLWPSAGGTCCWSVLTVLRKTNPCCHSRCLGKHSLGALLSQAFIQYLLLVALVDKALLQLREKKGYRNPACWCMTMTRQRARRRGKTFREESRVSAQGMWSARDSRERHKLISDTCSNWENTNETLQCSANPQSLTVGCSL